VGRDFAFDGDIVRGKGRKRRSNCIDADTKRLKLRKVNVFDRIA